MNPQVANADRQPVHPTTERRSYRPTPKPQRVAAECRYCGGSHSSIVCPNYRPVSRDRSGAMRIPPFRDTNVRISAEPVTPREEFTLPPPGEGEPKTSPMILPPKEDREPREFITIRPTFSDSYGSALVREEDGHLVPDGLLLPVPRRPVGPEFAVTHHVAPEPPQAPYPHESPLVEPTYSLGDPSLHVVAPRFEERPLDPALNPHSLLFNPQIAMTSPIHPLGPVDALDPLGGSGPLGWW